MNKTLLTLALLFAAPTTLATAPSSAYIQVQDDTTDGAAEQAGEAVDGAAAATGEAIDDAAAATGEVVDDAAAATGEAVDDAAGNLTGADEAIDPNGDGVVDANNNGTADTREFPWGLLGLLGLFGLLGRNRPATVTTTTDRR
ncbi:hypothetical protein [Deinococcus puniceus]|uniref:MYXO-CTERM domain-containing protein n=1 Tax=Deinococcus puniceus TaxID=1182568 RepID=A0A172T639_9DEIO|nr:hypothetical protein [Deinococcus puniceus]ANE42417.1 hypothetical protein SU48_00065 [Deinococcus puniceus]